MFCSKTLKITQTVVNRKTEQGRTLQANYLAGVLCCFYLKCFYIESWLQRVIEKSAEHKVFP